MPKRTLEKYRQLVGVRTDIKREVLDRQDYKYLESDVIKVRYTVHPFESKIPRNDAGSAYIVIPKERNGRIVFTAHQHGLCYSRGKSQVFGHGIPGSFTPSNDYKGVEDQVYGIELVESGFIVISSDVIPFEDRMFFDELTPAYKLDSTDSWQLCNMERYVDEHERSRGRNLASRHLYDDMGAIDVAQEILGQEITELGAIGHSMGGGRIFNLLMLDPRVKVGVSSCGLVSVEGYHKLGLFHNYAFALPGAVSEGLDYQEAVKLVPEYKFLMMFFGEHDNVYPLQGTLPVMRASDPLSNVSYRMHNGMHEFPDDCRSQSYRFLNGKLKRFDNKIAFVR